MSQPAGSQCDTYRSTMAGRANWWRIVYYALFAIWFSDAVLVMSHVKAGLFTSYAADLTLPAWLYVVSRKLHDPATRSLLSRTVGRSPELAASALFIASTATELQQLLWPSGFFAGRFDPIDILAYAVGIGACYFFDSASLFGRSMRRPEQTSGTKQ